MLDAKQRVACSNHAGRTKNKNTAKFAEQISILSPAAVYNFSISVTNLQLV